MSIRVSPFAILCLLAGCEPSDKSDDGSLGQSDTGTVLEDDPCDEDPVTLRREATGRTCPMPTECVGLPEAYDRGWVAFSYGSYGLTVESLYDHTVCIDGWYLLISTESQDSGFGDPGDGFDPSDSSDDGSGDDGSGDDGSGDGSDGSSGDDSDGSSGDGGSGDGGSADAGDDGGTSGGGSADGADGDGDGDGGLEGEEDDPCDDDEEEASTGGRIRLAPHQSVSFGYAGGAAGGLTEDNPTWWCVEQTQVTVATENWEFLGSRMPGPLLDYAVLPTDMDFDGVEDHSDTSTGQYQTNHNIWDHMAAEPMFTVGRDRHYLDLAPGEAQLVTLTVRNMGRIFGLSTVEEVLPYGVEPSNIIPEPTSIDTDWRGRTVLTWDVRLPGAEDTGSYEHTIYAEQEIRFAVTMQDIENCADRKHGGNPKVSWSHDGQRHHSFGSPLIVGCCTED